MTEEFNIEELPTAQLRTISASLQNGGPPVNHALIAQSVAGILEPEVEETVRDLTRMYRPWFREYWAFYTDSRPDAGSGNSQLPDRLHVSDDLLPNPVRNRIAKYFAMADEERRACYGEVGTRGDGTPLNPYIADLALLIREEWNWEDQRQQPEFESKEAQAEILHEFLVNQSLDDIPFPLELVAVELVQMGLDRLCGIED